MKIGRIMKKPGICLFSDQSQPFIGVLWKGERHRSGSNCKKDLKEIDDDNEFG